MFMSDNGSAYRRQFREVYGHDQNSLDFDGTENISLRGGKNDIWEGGHRVPFMWWYPTRFSPQVNTESVVSQMDIYRTLADIIDVKVKCNEAPDSRTLLPILEGGENVKFPKGSRKIIHHGMKKATIAFRRHDWKWIPAHNELFNMRQDIAENHNLYEDHTHIALEMNRTVYNLIDKIEQREIFTASGTNGRC